jgi:2-polyprenyl-3-methyl-5-hydroxy-6-metoxy-1,4-benzoquinol methylase
MVMTYPELAAEWTRVIAPDVGDVRLSLLRDAAEFLGITFDEARSRVDGARDRFRAEWERTVANPADAAAVTRFYNQSNTELFELLEWHAADPIHYRTLVLRDFALARPGRAYLDYGSGIGNDALVFLEAGFDATLADISDYLLAFAAWRCRRRGFSVRTIDLKREEVPPQSFDVIACFDVLEHIPKPTGTVRTLRRALRSRGLLAIHAPFAKDPDRPMHVVHSDVVTPRMRSIGFQPVEVEFPEGMWAPRVWERREVTALDRAGYYVYDNYLNNAFGDRLATLYRRTLRRRPAGVPATRGA